MEDLLAEIKKLNGIEARYLEKITEGFLSENKEFQSFFLCRTKIIKHFFISTSEERVNE